MRPSWCDTRTDVVAPECASYGEICDVSSDGTAHYEVTLSDGTWLRLEKRVEQTRNWRGWIRNHDRAGWYTTRIQYPDGGSAKVTYHGGVPEAIQRIESEQYPTTYWIETTLWSSFDAGYVPFTQGMLKEVKAPLPNGQQWIAKFHYTTVQDDLGEGTVTLKLLQSVTFPTINGETPTITYGYLPGTAGSEFGIPGHGYLLETITYPTGGVSRYSYSSWTCGVGSKQHDPEHGPRPRTCTASVSQRALYPQGLSGPKSIWNWERRFKAADCILGTLGTGIENYFRVTGPDGVTTESTAYDSPCGNYTVTLGEPLLERPGQIKTVKTFQSGISSPVVRTIERTFFDEPNACLQGDGDLFALRAVNELLRDTSTIQTETTTYHDEKTQCFESGASSTTRAMTTHFAHRDAWNVPHLTWVTGDYMEKRGGTPVSRVGRVKFHTPATTPKKRLERHVLGTYSSAFVEETTGAVCSGGSGDCSSARYEVSFEFDGDSAGDLGNGRLKKITANDAWQPVSTNLSASPPTFNENAAGDASDLVSSLTYQSNGNLASATFSGGDADLDGSRQQYTILYTWQQAMAATMQVQGLNYLSRQIAVDSGKVEQDCDPNGLCSHYSFDPLGRLTTIDPPGSVEQTSRIVYPSLKATRLIQQASTSVTNFEPNNAEQIFGEVRYDGLGRIKERIKALPDGTLGVQIVKYDDLGRAVFTSETMSATDSDGDGTYTLDTACGDGTRGQIDWLSACGTKAVMARPTMRSTKCRPVPAPPVRGVHRSRCRGARPPSMAFRMRPIRPIRSRRHPIHWVAFAKCAAPTVR